MALKISDYIWNKDNEEYVARKIYSPYALQQTRNILKNWIDDFSNFRKNVTWITIDWKESKDLDDAIWAEKFWNWYKVFIHIADPSEAVLKYSPLDIEALKRTTSLYTKEGIFNMFPPELANEVFSLNESWEKLTLTMEIDLDFDWNINNFKTYESKFKNLKRNDYESFIDDFINPDSIFHKNYQIMYEIAKKRTDLRKKSWAKLDFDETDRRLYLWEKEDKLITNVKKIPHQIVEEWAILWNICAAIYLTKNDLHKVFRVHLDLDEKAFYSEKDLGHKALALKYYTHYTSPIRRYSDMIVHRIIKDDLNNRNSLYESEEIKDILKHINKKSVSVQVYSKYFKNDEIWWKEKIKILKNIYWEDLKAHHFKIYIRNLISENKNIPKSMISEIKNDINFWDFSDWCWSIWLFLISNEKDIKDLIFKKIIKEKIVEPLKIINILNNTKIIRWDKNWIFEINEEILEDENICKINFSFKWKLIFEFEEYFSNEFDKKFIIFELREKIIKKIFELFI